MPVRRQKRRKGGSSSMSDSDGDTGSSATASSTLQKTSRCIHGTRTDGSKSEDGSVSAGLFIPSTQLATAWLLRQEHTVLGAELFAIYKAMQLVTENGSLKEKSILILTDSRSTLQLLSNSSGHSYRTIIFEIQKLMLVKGLDRVVLCWVRGHSGIHGNEVADRVANLAHSNNRSARSRLCFEEWIRSLKSLTVQEWTRQWAANVQETGKGTFQRSLGHEIAFVDYGVLPRSVECAVSRLRLGHAGVYAHLARFNLANSRRHYLNREGLQSFMGVYQG
ncbi:uncharacterized protein LOC108666391 [Hyalella azteca]|uniref:Uncharacterized protein LOC108666391 n=1 Tax=Hyalella azteca TaxID=294128 RepID=A0A8B7N4F6_HYAAZ|nr:uncharacterized protein LOC108666391 [Hyalella azteca]